MNKNIWIPSLIYMAAVIHTYPVAEQENYCIVDYCVFGMRPLRYFITMALPLLLQSVFCWKQDFLPMLMIRRMSWRNNLFRQEMKCCKISVLYALAFLCLVVFLNAGKELFNWNTGQSYYMVETGEVSPYGVFEIFLCLLFMCFIRNFMMLNLVLVFLWKKGNGIYGFFMICVIDIFEITQEKIKIFNWMISPDYRVWCHTVDRIYMAAGVVCYLLLGWAVFSKILNRKELLG